MSEVRVLHHQTQSTSPEVDRTLERLREALDAGVVTIEEIEEGLDAAYTVASRDRAWSIEW